MILRKINETFSELSGDPSDLNAVSNRLKVERENAYFDPMVKRGLKSPYVYFSRYHGKNLVVYNGHLPLINLSDPLEPDFTLNDIQASLKEDLAKLPFKPYDYQLKAVIDAILRVKGISKLCTGSGKSLIISLILSLFYKHGKKCLLLVPNINLLNQFKSDLKSYNLDEVYENTEILGDSNLPSFNKPVLISTWQSLIKYKDQLDVDPNLTFDLLIEDEIHRESSEVSSEIAQSLFKTKYRLGFTGTMPDDKVQAFTLLGLFGQVKTYITSHELIERGLATPIDIESIIISYKPEFRDLLRATEVWSQQLKLIKEYKPRNELISKLAVSTYRKRQNTLVLYSHTEHGKKLYQDIFSLLYPNETVKNTDLTGKDCFEFQKQHHVYFINGEVTGKNREIIRQFLENEDGAILVSVYAVMSTGVNMKKLHNLIMASPLKAYTTITQSLGRGMRLHESKQVFKVFDLVDNLGIRKPTGVFYKQYKHRLKTSYQPEEFPVHENFVSI